MFSGSNLRLIRQYHGFSLEQVADTVGKTRQYIHKIEVGGATPTQELTIELANALGVAPDFFSDDLPFVVSEEIVHFRKLASTKVSTKYEMLARAEVFSRLVDLLEDHLTLPPVSFPSYSTSQVDEIEKITERCRSDWGLGFGPIDNVTRLAEKMGALVTSFESLSDEIDALSIPLARPLIIRNSAKKSPCRMRFDIAHEIGHLILHEGITTGDRKTETEANRFASSFLIPRTSMMKFFPKFSGTRVNWKGLSEFKLEWKVSKAAIIYRAHQLNIIDDNQYKAAFLGLKRKGESIDEKEDNLIPHEAPALLEMAFGFMLNECGFSWEDIAKKINISTEILSDFIPQVKKMPKMSNVVPLFR